MLKKAYFGQYGILEPPGTVFGIEPKNWQSQHPIFNFLNTVVQLSSDPHSQID